MRRIAWGAMVVLCGSANVFAYDQCRAEVARGWLAEFHGDQSFAGLVLAADGNSATLNFMGGDSSFQRLLPDAHAVLRSQRQPVRLSDASVQVKSMDGAQVQSREVQYSLSQLIDAFESACRVVTASGSGAMVGIDLDENRVRVWGDPAVVKVSGSIYLFGPEKSYSSAATLREYKRPLFSGTQSLHAGMNSTNSFCTIGFIIKQGFNYRTLVASHCTPQIYSVPGVAPPEFRQNGWTAFDGAGTEIIDPAPNCSGPGPGPCRRTDSAVSSIVGASYQYGWVATPTMLSSLANPSCITTTTFPAPPSCPEIVIGNNFALTAGPSLQFGQTIEHIGRTTGRIQARYVGTISAVNLGSHNVGSPHRAVVLPGVSWTTGSRIASQGDSGGPVVRWYGVSYIPEGVLFAERSGLAPSEPPEFLFNTLADIALDIGAFSVF